MKTLLSRAALAAAAMAFGLSGAYASITTGTLPVTLQVTGTCTINSAALKFGAVTGQTDADGFGFISITCGAGASYTILLDNGLHHDGSTRRMENKDATNWIAYTLNSDSSQTVWSSAGVTQKSSGTDIIKVYGHANASNAPTGDYSDNVQITINY
jgi:spore coat protein U-like protein